MGKRKGDQPNRQAQEPSAGAPAKLAPPPAPPEAASPEPARIEAPAVAPPLPEVTVPIAPAATAEAAPVAASVQAPKLEAAMAELVTPSAADLLPDDTTCDEAVAAAAAPTLLSAWTTRPSFAHGRLASLAATIAIAAVLGAMAGALTSAGLGGASVGAPVAQADDARALNEQIARLHADIAAVKASIESSAKSSSAQYIKLGDRLDRFEKAQAEPAAKLAKVADAVDRIEHRTPTLSAASAAREITGSVSALAPAPQLAAAPETRPATPPVLEAWRVRSVYNGAALIQARGGGIMEVEPGDSLPGLGRIEAIRRQEGKWVVVTSKGLIVAR